MSGFFKRIFGKRYTPPIGNGTAAGNWQRGDLAVSIFPDAWKNLKTGEPSENHPEFNCIYCVADVSFWNGFQVLNLAEFPADEWSTAASFRKAVIDKDEQCEPEFVTLLKHIKRKQVA